MPGAGGTEDSSQMLEVGLGSQQGWAGVLLPICRAVEEILSVHQAGVC